MNNNVRTTEGRRNYLEIVTKMGVYVVFAAVIIFFAVSNPRFIQANNIALIIQQASPMGIAVVGVVYVLVIGGLDISIGANMYFTAIIMTVLVNEMGLFPQESFDSGIAVVVILILAAIIGGFIGALNGFLITKFKLLPFIVTLSMLNILKGFGYMISDSSIQPLAEMSSFANGRLGPIPIVAILFVVVIVVFDFILRKCVFGRQIMAMGNSISAARNAGVKIQKNTIICYMICGTLGAVAGIISAGQIGTVALNFGDGNEFIVISAAVLGGTSLFGGKGTIFPGAVIGILLITIIMNGLAMINVSPYVYTIVRGAIISIAVMMDSIKFKGELR